VFVLVTICFGGSVGLGTVWLRHQISMTANTNRALAAQIVEIERRIAETRTLVESEQSPELLRQRNHRWRLGLVPVSEGQKIHVPEDPVRRLAAKANRELFGDPAAAIQFRVSLAQ
jgi:hypothetical protein